MVKIKQVTKLPIFHVVFPNQYQLTSTLVRIQEFYESEFKTIRNHIFTLDQFMDQYAKKHGNFTYFSDWNGFNFSSEVLFAFLDKFRGSYYRPKEKQFITQLWDTAQQNGRLTRYYVIATHDKSAIKHEIAHAMYFLLPDYKKEVDQLIRSLRLQSVRKRLLRMGYCVKVLNDEIQAFFSTSTLKDLHGWVGKNNSVYRKQFRTLYKKYWRRYVSKS